MGGLDPRTAIEGSFSAWGGLGKPNRRHARGETFFPDSGSDRGSERDSDETFQISRNLGLEHVEFFCLLDSQPWMKVQVFAYNIATLIIYIQVHNHAPIVSLYFAHTIMLCL
jgi:hypothetical protein